MTAFVKMPGQQAQHLLDGSTAEKLALEYLLQQGLSLREKNFRCSHGEIDLVMQDGETLVFVEVRLRSSMHYGGAAMSINASKQNKLKRSAERYLQTHGEKPCRFDVVLMQAIDVNKLEWLKNAFD